MAKSVQTNNNKIFENPMRLYRSVIGAASVLCKLIFRMEIKGAENMPKEGACFVCGNHLSNWDPVLMAVAVKRPVHFMAKKELFKIPVLGSIVRTVGAFPIDRDGADLTAIKTALGHIKHGNPLGIFPQGTRCIGKSPEEIGIKNGTGMLVHKTEATVIPVSIYTKDYRIKLFRKVYVTVGKPITPEDYKPGEKSPEEYQRISDIIFDTICKQVNASKEEAERK